MGNPNTIMRPLYIANQIVERISSYKLLGVIIKENLKWNCHVDYITAKASKKLYALRLFKRAGVQEQGMLKVFHQFYDMPCRCGKTFLTICKIEQSPCKKGPLKSHILIVRTVKLCRQPTKLHFPTDASSYVINLWLRADTRDHPLSCLVSTAVQRTKPYNLRPGSSRPFNKFMRTKRAENFFTVKYSSSKYPS